MGHLLGAFEDRAVLGKALRTVDPAIETLADQSDEILTLMEELRQLSSVGSRTLRSTRSSLLQVLDDLGPILRTLTNNDDRFREIMNGIRDFSRGTTSATYGLFLNFDLTMVVDQNLLPSSLIAQGVTP